MSKRVLALDPGNHTGWCYRQEDGKLLGGTLPEDHMDVMQLIIKLLPEVVVFESFKLYPSKARSLAWNSFYPCEVIGVIKLMCSCYNIPTVEQAPSIKKYAGSFQDDFQELATREKEKDKHWLTEHVKDAYQHLRYYERYKKEPK